MTQQKSSGHLKPITWQRLQNPSDSKSVFFSAGVSFVREFIGFLLKIACPQKNCKTKSCIKLCAISFCKSQTHFRRSLTSGPRTGPHSPLNSKYKHNAYIFLAYAQNLALDWWLSIVKDGNSWEDNEESHFWKLLEPCDLNNRFIYSPPKDFKDEVPYRYVAVDSIAKWGRTSLPLYKPSPLWMWKGDKQTYF